MLLKSQTDRQTDRQIEEQTDRQTEEQTQVIENFVSYSRTAAEAAWAMFWRMGGLHIDRAAVGESLEVQLGNAAGRSCCPSRWASARTSKNGENGREGAGLCLD